MPNTPYDYLETLTQTQYNAFTTTQKVNCICDIASFELGLRPHSRDGVVFTFNLPAASDNPREPFMRLYHNAGRCVDNNWEMAIAECNDYLKFVEPLEFECGFNKPDSRYYERKHSKQIQPIQGVRDIEICQDSINIDTDDLVSVRKHIKKWYHIILYDWLGKMIDAATEGS